VFVFKKRVCVSIYNVVWLESLGSLSILDLHMFGRVLLGKLVYVIYSARWFLVRS
jgi:hypothetical protein